MPFEQLTPGANAPEEINVVIEIPSHGDPVKYEVDKSSGAMFVDRFMNTAMYYPCNYGYIPQTLSDDGDPADVLVITPVRLLSGAVISARPIGMLMMTDEAGHDAKILAVPSDSLTPVYRDVKEPSDVAPGLLDTITHFFEHYKDLEKNKWVKIEGWESSQVAKKEIIASIDRYQPAKHTSAT